jgi:hypothetical protein
MMRNTRLLMTIAYCIFTTSLALAQQGLKPGLYETTANWSWQKSPFPPGMQMPPQAAAAFGGGTHTTQGCLSQAWIDRLGGPIPQDRGECRMTDISRKVFSMTATEVCSGRMSGTASVEVDWSLLSSAKGKVHFVGSLQMGPNSTPIEWTNEFTSVYKGPDCGSVKPAPLPSN